jgi:hypothetical protein
MLVLALAAFPCQSTFGAENGTPPYAFGSLGYNTASSPPVPGLYWVNQTIYLYLHSLYGNDGEKLPLAFHGERIVNVNPFLKTWPLELPGGGLLASSVSLPVVKVISQRVGRLEGSTSGVGSLTLTPAVAIWHLSSDLTMPVGISFYTPSPAYSKDPVKMVGVNYWSVQPTAGLRYGGPNGLDIGILPRLALNTENDATHYQSGKMFFLDYSVTQRFGDFAPGVAGGLWKQFSDDFQNGRLVNGNGNRSSAVVVGPTLAFLYGRILFNVNYQHSFAMHNTAGTDSIFLNVAVPLSSLLSGEATARVR